MAVRIEPLPPEEAIAAFDAKLDLRSFDWRDLWEQEHQAAFTVAKAMRLDVLADIRAAVRKGLAEGRTLQQLRPELEPLLRAKGWWGRQKAVDPVTGVERVVQLGSPHRLATILDTNLRTAYAAGHWERAQRAKRALPFFRYVATLDTRVRPQHRAWHGTILPVDHPWWRTHWPPNGFRCRCSVVQLSQRDLDRRGWKVADEAPAAAPRPWKNRRTGRVEKVPAGIDPGFAHNVGIASARDPGAILTEKLQAAEPDLARAAVGDMLQSEAFARLSGGKAKAMTAPAAILDEMVRDAIGSSSSVAVLSADSGTKQAAHHPDVDPRDYEIVQRALDHGEIIADRALHVSAFVTDAVGRVWRAVVKSTRDGREAYLLALYRVSRRNLGVSRRTGKVIRRGVSAPGGT